MGGKKGVSAKEKASEKAKEQANAAAKAAEDADWAAAGEGKRTKAQAKRGAKDEDRQEAQAKKEEARRLAQEEEAALERAAKKAGPGVAGAGKKTAFELAKQRDAEARSAAEEAARREQERRREVGEEEYARLMAVGGPNTVDGIDARNVEAAIAQLGVGEEQPKMKFSQYHERELPTLRKEKPGLKAPQYKDMLWKKWQRSPENPLNQKAA